MKSLKRRHRYRSDTDNDHKEEMTDKLCIIHFKHSTCESFQPISDCKGPENRLEKFQEIARKTTEVEDLPYLMEHYCRLVPEVLRPEHGYLRDCYQGFTKNLDCLKGTGELHEQARTSVRASGTSEKVIFKPECIFCKKEARKK